MKLSDILSCPEDLYAHRQDNKAKETLPEHTGRCEKYFERVYSHKELWQFEEKFLKLAPVSLTSKEKKLFHEMLKGMITCHDVGKVNPEFQRIKMGCMEWKEPAWKCLNGADHALLSAVLYLDFYWGAIKDAGLDKTVRQFFRRIAVLNAYVISRHHSELGSLEAFTEKFLKNGSAWLIIQFLLQEQVKGCHSLRYFTLQNVERTAQEWKRMEKDFGRKEQIGFFIYLRMAYSVLVMSDYYATAEYMSGAEMEKFGNLACEKKLSECYEQSELLSKIRLYESKGNCHQGYHDINQLRSELFLEAENCWKRNRDANIFFLEAPTGSGKSNTAINLSNQMMKAGAKKIFYVYPFNTLIEQNLETLEKIYGNAEEVFSQIAVVNSVTPIKTEKKQQGEEDAVFYQKALLDRQFLNYPFVLTTHVSLFDTMFGNQKEALFGFLQLKDSVVVLDEIQSYKNKLWSEIIIFLREFADLLNIKFIIMSATLPDLEYLTGEAQQAVRLIENREKYFSHPLFRNRVRIDNSLLGEKMDLEKLCNHIISHTGAKKVLVEFIKKNRAYECFRMLSERCGQDVEVLCLTGDDSRLERGQILERVKETTGKGVILVATQVVEAGVDIDMDVGYKNISILDSEEQFLGRINRSCKRIGTVYFFELDSVESIYGSDIRSYSGFTLRESEMYQILEEKNFPAYYKKILDVLKKNWNEGEDSNGLQYFFEKKVGTLDCEKIAEHMKLIDDNWRTISVFLARIIEFPDGTCLDGMECWETYKNLLMNPELGYAEKQIRLSKARSDVSYFVYEIHKNSISFYNDRIGELYLMEDGDRFFENGKLNKERLERAGGLFIG